MVWEVRGEAERVLAERRAFRERIDSLPGPRCDPDASELIYGELVANVVRHAKGTVAVQLAMDDGDRVLTVRDWGPGLHGIPAPKRRDPMAESGRGLAIVEVLARCVAVQPAAGGGTEVRAVLPVVAA